MFIALRLVLWKAGFLPNLHNPALRHLHLCMDPTSSTTTARHLWKKKIVPEQDGASLLSKDPCQKAPVIATSNVWQPRRLESIVKSDGSDEVARIAKRMMPCGAVQIFCLGERVIHRYVRSQTELSEDLSDMPAGSDFG